MGIVNVTPDSFSGDGVGSNVDAAVALARRFVEEGVDILDIGGESTRPGSKPVSIHEEIDRVIPVVRRLAAELPVPISVDSYKVPVVRAALEAGARLVNDIWGLRHDVGLANLAATYDVPLILMHNRRAQAAAGRLGGHFRQVPYEDLMGDIFHGLSESVELALRRHVKWENILVDPGIGFGKTPEQNLVVMRRLRELRALGRPILMGTSRKSVVGLTLGVPMGERLEGTAATVAVTICNGADIVRVHDVREMARVSRMTDAIVRV
jgi:dihydropteroate synthase